ncbi:ATP-dependent helicase [Bacillus sp. S3]|uniref:UvrD-helicase domain-containing protein n=1 Tax=Bacillus sp. S3 TaxID=486398 RepID=UPI001187D5F2|nr:UvrD-helicase domain-containing protein [Bacillus sp. S3]QCJ42590.1 ATP-dependent helicase [Bacillus sp. S3]
MIEITKEDIRMMERLLLPEGSTFNNEQESVLIANDSADIEACPGSGKTTVLIAKVAILLKKLEQSSSEKGICVITHTNVAVDEIKEKLQLVGIPLVKYPHFIGTIQEFFNHFFSSKAYRKLFNNDKQLMFLDNDEYEKYFTKNFIKFKPQWWNARLPLRRMREIRFDFRRKDLGLSPLDETNVSIAKTILYLIKQGIFRHIETLTLADWYLSHYENEVYKALPHRFSYFLMDETQDTSQLQFKLVNKIVNKNKIVFQKYGDPYQALYNIYNGETDSWIPEDEEKIEIAQSNRFGENIANILRTTCKQRYDHLKGNNSLSSFKPYLLLYDFSSKRQVLDKFAEIVKEKEVDNEDFKNNKKDVYAICQHHLEVNEYFQSYIKENNDKKNTPFIQKCFKMLQSIVTKLLRDNADSDIKSSKDLENYLNKYGKVELLQLRSIISKLIKVLELEKNQVINSLKDELSSKILDILEICSDEEIDISSVKASVDQTISEIKKMDRNEQQSTSITNKTNIHGVNINLGSIHGVKGETHKATLILESNRMFNEEPAKDLTKIFSFLVGEYDENLASNQEIQNILKLAYVGISRPTHLVAVALDKSNIENYDENIHKAIHFGWEVVNI